MISDSKNQKGLADTYLLTLVKSHKFGGVDGARTRDPRRDRPESKPSNDATFSQNSYSKNRPSTGLFAGLRSSHIPKFLACLAVAFALTACGGGGSSAPAPEPGVPEPYVISAYGDSTQEAQGQPHAASRPGAKIYNRGVSGTNSAQLLAGTDGRNLPWDEQMRVETARIVVINHGINDRGRAVEDYKADLRALVEGIRKVGKVPMLEEPNPINEPGFDDYRNAMKHVANHMGVYFCAQPRVPLADDIHPTMPEGYKLIADVLAKCAGDVL